MPTLTTSLLAAAAALAAPFALAPRDALRTEITINAPPSTVWAILADGAAYAAWNPFIRAMSGRLVAGARLRTTMQAGGAERGMTFMPVVLKVEVNRELRWRGRLLAPRVMDAEHSFVLEPVEGGTRLIHAETFHGIAMWFFRAETFRPDFEAMNTALKRRAEVSVPQHGDQ